jgi:glycerol-3-phosphate acyltransferase PlsY
MNIFVLSTISLVMGYFLGSIPSGFIVGKLKGIDLTKEGSGSIGTTNTLRLLGKKAAAVVFLGDFFKGFLAVYLTGFLINYFQLSDSSFFITLCQIIAATASVFGHSKSLWINFKGGKSVATGVGVLFALDWMVAAIALATWIAVVYFSKISSLGALIAAPLVPVLMIISKIYFNPTFISNYGMGSFYLLTAYAFISSSYIVFLHKANIKRLIEGTEPKIGEKK